MKNILTKLNLLLFTLRKKLARLEQIKAYTLCQAPGADKAGLTTETILAQKQEWIEEITKLDQGFSTLSAELLPFLQENPGQYRESIVRMQELIEQIMAVESEIRQAEKRNYAEVMLGSVKKEAKVSRPLPQAAGLKKYQQAKKGLQQEKKDF